MLTISLFLLIASIRLANAVQQSLNSGSTPATRSPRPLVIWHGLGDTAYSPGISDFIMKVQELYPGIYVHSVKLPINGTVDNERRAGFYGNASLQVDEAAEAIRGVPELANGFDGFGFSQGGIFLRDYVQRYNDPPVGNLVTFGSPHMGIAKALVCAPRDFLCIIASRSVERSAYSKWAQANVIQAEYFRDHNNLNAYYAANEYLTRLNGELETQPLARENIASLSNLVLIRFDADKTVFPSVSTHFGSLTPSIVDADEVEIPLEGQEELWAEDSVGLRELSTRGGLVFERCPGQHMELGKFEDEDGCARRMLDGYIGRNAPAVV